MKKLFVSFSFFICVAFLCFVQSISAQADDICGEQGGGFIRNRNTAAVFGIVSLRGYPDTAKPKVTITLSDSQSRNHRMFPGSSGKYCFRDINGSGGIIFIEVDGQEMSRHNIPNVGPSSYRQDFDVVNPNAVKLNGSGSMPTSSNYLRSEENKKLFEAAAAAEKSGKPDEVIRLLRQIVTNDPKDHYVWSTLATVYFNRDDMIAAESSYTSALVAKPDLTSAMIGLGKIYLVQKKHDLAIDILIKAVRADGTSAPAYRLLGESLLLAKKGSLAVDALNEAIRLDPIGQAECHLLLAKLYDLAGAKGYASTEYRLYLEKNPNYSEKKKFEKYIKDNPEPKENK